MIRHTIEKQGNSWAIMQGLKTIALCLTLDQAHKQLEELTMKYTLIESNKMEKEDYVSNAKDYLEDKQKIILLEAELRLLRDWRDTWVDERTRVYKENDQLRKALSDISVIITKASLTTINNAI